MIRVLLALPIVLVSLAPLACGGDKPAPKTAEAPKPTAAPPPTETTSAKPSQMAVNVDEDIIKMCNLKFENVEDAPKFDYDSAREVLASLYARASSTHEDGESVTPGDSH